MNKIITLILLLLSASCCFAEESINDLLDKWLSHSDSAIIMAISTNDPLELIKNENGEKVIFKTKHMGKRDYEALLLSMKERYDSAMGIQKNYIAMATAYIMYLRKNGKDNVVYNDIRLSVGLIVKMWNSANK